MDLFDLSDKTKITPLAERVRPASLDDFVGQGHIVGGTSLLRRAIKADKLGSCIFYGPAGTGKTTLAHIIASTTKAEFVKLNAVSSGVADAKKVIDDARAAFKIYGKRTYLFLDECHRWNKAQSDSVLAAIEEGVIVFIGSTTENPYVSMTKAIVSRCRVFEFKKLSEIDIKSALKRALTDKNGLFNYNAEVDDVALSHIVWAADGDLRTALNALELAVITTPIGENGKIKVGVREAEESIQKKSLSVDEDMYYDMISAFIKSMRGSDPDAALYWAERLLSAGCDPMLILRRVMIHASEDVGMADPNALVIAAAATTAFQNIGLPEGKIPMYNAIIYISEAPKSNSVVVAMGAVSEAVQKVKDDNVPLYLRDNHYSAYMRDGERVAEQEKAKSYKYPHDFGGWVAQQYLPDSIKDEIFYIPTNNGFEAKLKKERKKQ